MTNRIENRVVEIRTIKGVVIKKLFEVVKKFIKETNLFITEEGIKISSTDISKQAFTYIKLDKDKFDLYEYDKPRSIGINFTTLYKVLKGCTRNDTITFYIEENEQEFMYVELQDYYLSKVKKYKLPILELEDININIKNKKFNNVINISTKQFQQVIKDIQLIEGKIVDITSINKEVIFSCSDGSVEFKITLGEPINDSESEESESSSSSQESTKDSGFNFVIDENEQDVPIIQGAFKVCFLNDIIKASHLCENMNILMSNDKPLILEYFIGDLGVLLLELYPTQLKS